MKKIKHSKTLLLLGILVITVWGMVVSRMMSLTGKGENKQPVEVTGRSGGPVVHDTLLLNYRDPFFSEGGGVVKPVPLAIRPLSPSAGNLEPPPPFRMRGKIRKGVKDFLLLEMEGKNSLVCVNGKVNGYTVRKIFDDSAIITVGRRKYTLKLE